MESIKQDPTNRTNDYIFLHQPLHNINPAQAVMPAAKPPHQATFII
ncbi:hypothetical protein OIU79_023996 [Salix purpurea]|uniref:Uncharacterized protein n=1 Tax=Salix purpurea TaxID=77065 RepID=A0A9Q0WAE7_SALPP|nr:hypothetical protein OIU79_023996 [Salix purpurea]